jgi:hypothetical protein
MHSPGRVHSCRRAFCQPVSSRQFAAVWSQLLGSKDRSRALQGVHAGSRNSRRCGAALSSSAQLCGDIQCLLEDVTPGGSLMRRSVEHAIRPTGASVLLPQTLQVQGEAPRARKERDRCFLHKRRVIWPAAWLLVRPMQVAPPCKPEPQPFASMRGCAGNSALPWEPTVFKRLPLEPWLWPSRSLPGSEPCRLRRMVA